MEKSIFRIEMLPAGHGDCILVSYGNENALKHILIDGGPYYFYANKDRNELGKRQALSNRLEMLAGAGSSLELMTVTHIDADHIEAMVKWIGSHPERLPIKEIWFNGRQHLESGWMRALGGEFLGRLIEDNHLPWNEKFNQEAVVCRADRVVSKSFDGGMQLTLLSPDLVGLTRLADVWDEELKQEGLDPKDHQQVLARLNEDERMRPEPSLRGWMGPEFDVEELAESEFDEDDAIANGSSIAFLAEYQGKAALFAGDAHPSTLICHIKQLLEKRGKNRLKLDAFKIPHHASKKNINRELLQLLDCKRYLISTNGSYFRHPDKEAIARILKYGTYVFNRNHFNKAELCFNYQKPAMAAWHDDDLERYYGYKAIFPPKSGSSLEIDL